MNSLPNKLKSIPLEKKHLELGAKMVSFGGWNMPIHYSKGIIQEHLHTRARVSIFDCSHMGQFRIRGEHACRDLDYLFPRTIRNQKQFTCRYNFLLDEEGTVIDDLIVYRISEYEFYLVVNGATISKDTEHIKKYLSEDTEFIDESTETAKLDIQGPDALRFMRDQEFLVNEIPKYYGFVLHEVKGIPCIISRTGYTGECGFEIYFSASSAEILWDTILNSPGIQPAGLGARDTLRLEMGYPLYGHELDQNVTPIEAGFNKILDLVHPFVGRETLLNRAPQKKLVGVLFDGRRAVREGAQILDSDEKEIGLVTSGSFSPSLKRSISMAYLNSNVELNDRSVLGKIGKNLIPGVIEKLPFYRNGSVRVA